MNKFFILATSLIIILLLSASTYSPNKFKNLKVLPQDISEWKLDSIMNSYCVALKVSCDFCHTQKKDPFNFTSAPKENDFSTDNPMKENARKMIRLTIDVNKNYFNFDSLAQPEYLNVVSCITCHRGNPYPVRE